jgi:hypothetical protein
MAEPFMCVGEAMHLQLNRDWFNHIAWLKKKLMLLWKIETDKHMFEWCKVYIWQQSPWVATCSHRISYLKSQKMKIWSHHVSPKLFSISADYLQVLLRHTKWPAKLWAWCKIGCRGCSQSKPFPKLRLSSYCSWISFSKSSIYPSIHPSISIYPYLSIHIYKYLSIYIYPYLSIHIYLSIHPSI